MLLIAYCLLTLMRIVVFKHAAVSLRHGRHGNEKYAAPVADTATATAATTDQAAAAYSNTTGTTAATGATVTGSAATATAIAAAGTSAANTAAHPSAAAAAQQQPYSSAARSTPNVIVSGTAFGLNRSDSNRALSATHVGDVAGGLHRGGLGKLKCCSTS
jgi:hypothetical protein